MRYHVTVADRSFAVDVVGERVLIDGKEVEAQLVAVPRTPLRQVVVEGAARTLAMLPNDAGWVIEQAGVHWEAEVIDDRTRVLQQLTGRSGGGRVGGVISAPMPGLVLRLEVEVGQAIEAGAGVVVLEAMKMENEIRAPGRGVVKAVHVQEGQAVEKGVPLVEIGEP